MLAIVVGSVIVDCVVVVVGVVAAPPVSACAAKEMVLMGPPVALALKPATKLSVFCEPLSSSSR